MVARSRNPGCSENTTMHSVCVVEPMSLSHNNAFMSNSYRRQQCILPGAAPFAHCPSADAQFELADRNDSWSVVMQLISLCQCCTRSERTDQSWSSSNCYIFWVCVSVVLLGFYVHGSVHHNTNLTEMTNKMQLCRTIYYSIVPWLLNMFRAILSLIIRSF
jgi:hypothetical protein